MDEHNTKINTKDRKREYMAKWRDENRQKYSEYMKEYNKKYKTENRNKMLEYAKKYYEQNKEKIKDQIRNKSRKYCEYCKKEISHFSRHIETMKHKNNVEKFNKNHLQSQDPMY